MATKEADKTRRARNAEEQLLEAAGQFLGTKGWTALVASVDRIQRCAEAGTVNYELVIRFTGGLLGGGETLKG